MKIFRSLKFEKTLNKSGVHTLYLSLILSFRLSFFIFLSPYCCSLTPSLSFLCVCLSVFLSLCLSVSLSLCLSVSLSLCLSVSVSLCVSVSLSICLSVSLSLCLSVSLSLCLSVSLSLCLSVSLSLCLSVFLYSPYCFSLTPSLSFLDVCLFVFLTVRQIRRTYVLESKEILF